jgi:MIP family channel proteins
VKNYLSEFIGTFCLVMAGTGAIVLNDYSHGAVTHAGVSLTFGLIVMAMILAVGKVSGAHLNPAVTLGLTAAGRFDKSLAMPYLLSQIAGAIAASSVLGLLFPAHDTLGATQPSGSALQSFALEGALTAVLMLTILWVTSEAHLSRFAIALTIGTAVGLGAFIGGPISGASMNPARSIGPALVAHKVADLWIYLTAPTLGALIAVKICRCLRGERCCPPRVASEGV